MTSKRPISLVDAPEESPSKKARAAAAPPPPPLTIAFVGDKGVGKSGLINFFLSQNHQSTRPLPSYLGPAGVTRDFFKIRFATGNFTLKESAATLFSAADTADVLVKLNKLPRSQTRRTFLLEGPFAGLPHHVTLVDCPGWGDASTLEFYYALRGVNAIVTVSSRTDEMREALFLGLGAHATTAVRALPLFVNARFVDPDAPPVAHPSSQLPGHPLARQLFINREPVDAEWLVQQVETHAEQERARIDTFHARYTKEAKGDGAGCLELLRSNDAKTETLSKVIAQFQADMFSLNGALLQPFDDQPITAVCVHHDPGRLLLHLGFTFENQFYAKLEVALSALLAANKIEATDFVFAWALMKTKAPPLYFAPTDVDAITPSTELEERWHAAHALLVAYRRDLRSAGIDVLQNIESELGFLRMK